MHPNMSAEMHSVRNTYCLFVPNSSMHRLKRGLSDQGRTRRDVQNVTSSFPIPRSVNMMTETRDRATYGSPMPK